MIPTCRNVALYSPTSVNVGTTFSVVLKNRASIVCSKTRVVVNPMRKRFRSSEYEDVDEALLKWFCGARDQNVPISGPLLLAKAKEFAEKQRNIRFQGSAGWLARFKRRHEVTFRSVSLEDYMTADVNVVAPGVPTEDDIIASVQSTDISLYLTFKKNLMMTMTITVKSSYHQLPKRQRLLLEH